MVQSKCPVSQDVFCKSSMINTKLVMYIWYTRCRLNCMTSLIVSTKWYDRARRYSSVQADLGQLNSWEQCGWHETCRPRRSQYKSQHDNIIWILSRWLRAYIIYHMCTMGCHSASQDSLLCNWLSQACHIYHLLPSLVSQLVGIGSTLWHWQENVKHHTPSLLLAAKMMGLQSQQRAASVSSMIFERNVSSINTVLVLAQASCRFIYILILLNWCNATVHMSHSADPLSYGLILALAIDDNVWVLCCLQDDQKGAKSSVLSFFSALKFLWQIPLTINHSILNSHVCEPNEIECVRRVTPVHRSDNINKVKHVQSRVLHFRWLQQV
jgi:hypothetical protein